MKNNIRLRKALIKIGISSNVLGYHYILKAVEILKKQKIHTNIGTIYEMIYKENNAISKGAVERAIRNAIKTSYKRGQILKRIYDIIPDNSVFLYDLVFNIDIIERECFK
jgi:hypothetical protein